MTTHLSIILPVYNEEARLRNCLDQLTAYFFNYTHIPFEIVCVLNGCTDGSAKIAYGFGSNWPQIKILNLQERGKGLAIKAGMLAASGQYRMMADVDLATPPSEFRRFLIEAQNGADLVAGVRTIRHSSLIRWLTHVGYMLMARPLTWVHDPQCGFKLFTAPCADFVFSHLQTTGWGFDVEALYLAGDGFRITEVIVPWVNDDVNSKLHPIKDGLRMARDLFRIRRLYPV